MELNGTNTTMTLYTTGLGAYLNKTDLVDYNYTYRIYGNDSANNWGKNASYWVVVDTTAPSVTILYPANSTFNTQTNFTVNANEPLTNCSFMLNGAANITMAAINSTAYKNNTIVHQMKD